MMNNKIIILHASLNRYLLLYFKPFLIFQLPNILLPLCLILLLNSIIETWKWFFTTSSLSKSKINMSIPYFLIILFRLLQLFQLLISRWDVEFYLDLSDDLITETLITFSIFSFQPFSYFNFLFIFNIFFL